LFLGVAASPGPIGDEAKVLSDEWMIHADRVLEDEQLIAIFFEALGKRHPKSKSRGREGTSAETLMRLMILKHIGNWSYVTLEREVRANLSIVTSRALALARYPTPRQWAAGARLALTTMAGQLLIRGGRTQPRSA
jgi:hypothetical protein